jgi:hypothetical protein
MNRLEGADKIIVSWKRRREEMRQVFEVSLSVHMYVFTCMFVFSFECCRIYYIGIEEEKLLK